MDLKRPVRTCICCRRKAEKNELLRVVKTPDGKIELDLSGKKDGRGAYVCANAECLKKLKKSKALSRAFKTEVLSGVYDEICDMAEVSFDGKK